MAIQAVQLAGGITTGAAKEDFPGKMCGAAGEAGQVQGGLLRQGPGAGSGQEPTEPTDGEMRATAGKAIGKWWFSMGFYGV